MLTMMMKSLTCVLLLSCAVTIWYIILLVFNKEVTSPFVHPSLDKLAINANDSGWDATKLMDLENFEYIIDAKCALKSKHFKQLPNGQEMKAVWVVTSYAGDVTKRSALRNAYTDEELRQLGIRRIFLLGTLNDGAQRKSGVTQLAIQNEAERFQDIIQGNFIEAYKNLTYKHLMGLQWAVDRCSNTHLYIMKMDDDIIVNIYEAMALLENKSSANARGDFLMGYAMNNMAPIRIRESKWFVTYEEFRGSTYPSFLSGWFYVLDMLTAMKLVFQSRQHAKYFWIDDLFITGILREEAGVGQLVDISEYFTSDYRFLKCCLKTQETLTKYKCDFIVGPDGGDRYLLSKFQKFSKECHYQQCNTRPKLQLLKDKCILDDRKLDLGNGNVQVDKMIVNSVF
ncbi:hypothetical protein QAD02_001990 [Eretmocerus hayati]|uniref:Uncharacterized protein n=1 Tax=Eretmocerus hayati TaxID=131215 RepID=A0ACC2NI06_9HYME|nr:hypothetical protein QAD02_001990 [Eretmocerus hayati]